MNSAVQLYEALTSAPDDRTRARLIAEAFERLEERYPHLPDLVTQGHLRETELRLQKEIEQLRAELIEKIERMRGEIQIDLTRQRGETGAAIERVKWDLLKWFVPLMFAQVAAIAALVKLL